MSVCDESVTISCSKFIVGFNPCFSGCRSAIYDMVTGNVPDDESFNPCFSGCRSAILKPAIEIPFTK